MLLPRLRETKRVEETARAVVNLENRPLLTRRPVGARLAELDGAGGEYADNAHVEMLKRALFLEVRV